MSALGQGSFFKENEAQNVNLNDQVWWDEYFFNQYPLENYNPDSLVANKGAAIYKRMMEDEQVKAAYEFIVSIIVSRNWRFEVTDDDPKQEEIKNFLEWNITQSIQSTFKQALKSILLSKAHGFSLSEKVFKVEDYEGSKVWSIKSIKPKYFDSFDLARDAFGNLKEIWQNHNGKRIKYNLDDFIFHVNFPEYEPVYGVSDLKAVYKAYWQKTTVEKFWAIYMERMAGGAIVAKPDPDNSVALNPQEKNDLKNTLRNMSRTPGIVMPKGWSLDLEYPNSTDAFERYVSMKDRQIARGLLMPSLSGLTEQQSTGSQALATVQERLFFAIMATQAEQLEETINEQLFAPLVQWNFGVKDFPRFKFDPYTEDQKRQYAESWSLAVDKGIVVNTFEDESRTRSLLNYPQREEGQEDNMGTDDNSGSDRVPEKEKEVPTKEDNFSENNSNIDIEAQRDVLDLMESRLKKKLSTNVVSIISSVTSSVREFIKVSKLDPTPLEEQLLRVKRFIPEEKSRKFRNDVKTALESTFTKGRSIASREIKKLKPKAEFKDEGLMPFDSFNILHFVDGLSLEKVEEILSAEAFNITSILEEDILKAVRQALIDGIQLDLSIDEIIQNLRNALAPIIGDSVINDANGKVAFDLDNQSRLETIARTNVNNVFNQAKVGIYTDPDLDNFVRAFEYTAILDSRTTKFCKHYDGFIRLVNDPIWKEITPPNHFNCRSTLIPITEMDTFTTTDLLPKDGSELSQPGKGFGLVSKKREK